MEVHLSNQTLIHALDSNNNKLIDQYVRDEYLHGAHFPLPSRVLSTANCEC